MAPAGVALFSSMRARDGGVSMPFKDKRGQTVSASLPGEKNRREAANTRLRARGETTMIQASFTVYKLFKERSQATRHHGGS